MGFNGARTAPRAARLGIVRVLTLSMTTTLGAGLIRDVLIDWLRSAMFSDKRYLAVAAAAGRVAVAPGQRLDPLAGPPTVLLRFEPVRGYRTSKLLAATSIAHH